MKTALITGIWGQDGSFLCEELITKGYVVHGIARKNNSPNSMRIKNELHRNGYFPIIHEVDLCDYQVLSALIAEITPQEIYHMAAYHVSSEGMGNGEKIRPQELFNKNVLAVANILEACKTFSPFSKVLIAGSCLMFDASRTLMQDEETPFESNSLYGMAKIAAHSLVKYYRKERLFVCSAILYNHESHRRSSQFVTKKIIENLVRIKAGEISHFTLGALDIQKDWGYAGDYADAMHRMLLNSIPKDYILSSGELHTIYDFVNISAQKLELEDWKRYVQTDKKIINRYIEGRLYGNNALIKKDLGWSPQKNFDDLISEMVEWELNERQLYENFNY